MNAAKNIFYMFESLIKTGKKAAYLAKKIVDKTKLGGRLPTGEKTRIENSPKFLPVKRASAPMQRNTYTVNQVATASPQKVF